MFGYVRPLAPELKLKEFERFRALYCGLCHELSRHYGLSGRMILNYDFLFLAMLLWGDREDCGYCFRRCPVHPIRKKCVCAAAEPLTAAAGYSVILSYWRADDGVRDGRGAKRLMARLLRGTLRRPYKKAAGEYPEFDRTVREKLAELAKLEGENVPSLDRPADTFASLLAAASEAAPEGSKRPLREVLYHVGRIIYIADGFTDLREDLKSGAYNPIAARYGLTSPEAPGEARESVRATLMSSAGLAAAAFELLPVSYWTPITENIIFLGLPDMIRQVLAGTYAVNLRGRPKRPELTPGGTENDK